MKKFKRKNKTLGLLLALLILIILWIYWGNTTISTRTITIKDSSIPTEFNNFKIAHVSDLHNKNWKDKLINILINEKPDLIAITGDLIDSRNPDEYVALDFINRAIKIAPIYYVSGNHEGRHPNYQKFKGDMETLGVNVLENSYEIITSEAAEIKLIGLNDPIFTNKTHELNSNGKILEYFLDEISNKHEIYSILLSHRPELFETYINKGIDLTLSGHAHGGQFRIPILGGVYAPGQGFFPKYDSGLYEKMGCKMIVSRGLGNSIIPIRINNRPEVIFIELMNKTPDN